MTDEIKPIHEVFADQMTSKNHSVIVWPFLYGQFRVQLTRLDRPDSSAAPGHGSIVRELCTYDRMTAAGAVVLLKLADDPEAMATAWNCEYPGGRIRLDATPPGGMP